MGAVAFPLRQTFMLALATRLPMIVFGFVAGQAYGFTLPTVIALGVFVVAFRIAETCIERLARQRIAELAARHSASGVPSRPAVQP